MADSVVVQMTVPKSDQTNENGTCTEPPPEPHVTIGTDRDERRSNGSSNHTGSSDGHSKKMSSFVFEHKMLSELHNISPVDIEFQDLSYSVSAGRKKGSILVESKTIVKNLNGRIRPGELTAVMGPSGSGKTTLVNILAGYKFRRVAGTIQVNGHDRDLRSFRKMSCYIMQDSQLLPHLTTLEYMMTSANLKLPESVSMPEKKALVDEIMEMMGLVECKNTRASHLSGGQRKRLSLAVELVSNPPIMFFDEPTSGLDSSSSYQVISILKTLAKGGRTIICTIHQPSARVFEMFDMLYVLSEGQCIYWGTTTGMIPFLSSHGLECPAYHNPADYIMEVASGEYGDHMESLTQQVASGKSRYFSQISQGSSCLPNNDHQLDSVDHKYNNEVPLPNGSALNETSLLRNEDIVKNEKHKHTFATSSWTQFRIIFWRSLICTFRDQTLTHIRTTAHIAVGLLVGFLYLKIGDDADKVLFNAGNLFFTILFLLFTALMPTILTFPVEATVFFREHLNYWYSLKAYYFAKTMADLPFNIVLPTIMCCITYWMTGQPAFAWRFFMFVLYCVLTSMVGQSLGLMVGAAFAAEEAIFLGPICCIPIFLFSGFFVSLDAIPGYFKWLSYISFIRYSFEGILVIIYGFDREDLECDIDVEYCYYKDPLKILEVLSVKDAKWYYDVSILFGFFIFFRICGYFALRYKLKKDR